MSLVQEVMDRKDRPAYVKFVREAIEDPVASRQKGMYVARDVDIACITPPYSKDIIKFEVPTWFENMQNDVRNGRMPSEWAQQYRDKYEAWKRGEELPLDGSAIKGWAVASPAAQETLLRMGILTVEDLAGINDEGIRRIGMGGVDLKHKAVAWLQAAKDRGPLVQEVAALKSENSRLSGDVANLTTKVEELMAALKAQPVRQAQTFQVDPIEPPPSVIPVSERAQLEADYRAKFGRAPHPSSNDATLRARLEE